VLMNRRPLTNYSVPTRSRWGPPARHVPNEKTPVAFVVLWWISVLTVIAGAVLPGMGMAAAVGLGWLLWRYLPTSADMLQAESEVVDDGDNASRAEERV
jgi:hypothetical protein